MNRFGTNQGWSKTGRGFGKLGPRGLLPLAALAAACSSLLGIEDVHEGPEPSGGSSGTGGASTTGGNGGKGGAGGVTGGTAGKGSGGATGGATGGGAGKGGAGKGGTTGGTSGENGEGGAGDMPSTGGTSGESGGAGNGGGGATGGTGGTPGDLTVRGKVVDHLLHPVANVPIWVGEEATSTDSDGEFEVEDVGETYDVQMVVTYPRYGATAAAGWVYEGLTRRDPTLQVYGGNALRSGNFTFTPTNPPADTSTTVVALGSEYGNYARADSGAVQTSFSWYGPATITATGHGLVWNETDGVPTAYTAYTASSSPFAFSDTSSTPWGLDLAANTVDTDTVSGTVVSPTTNERSNAAYVRFTSGAVIELANQTGANATANYSFLVPTLPNATITVVAREGNSSFGAVGVAHRSNVTSGQTTPALTIPTPPVILGPASGSTLNDSSMFSWNGSQDVSIVHMESNNFYESIYVVTAKKTIPMPAFINGFVLRTGDDAYFRVEVHGELATVDEAAGENGFVDALGPYGDSPDGPLRDAGTFALSAGSAFVMP
jgi:hypothetical protein